MLVKTQRPAPSLPPLFFRWRSPGRSQASSVPSGAMAPPTNAAAGHGPGPGQGRRGGFGAGGGGDGGAGGGAGRLGDWLLSLKSTKATATRAAARANRRRSRRRLMAILLGIGSRVEGRGSR